MMPTLNSALSLEQWEHLEADLFDGAGESLTVLRKYARAHHLPPVALTIVACLRVLSSLPGNVTFDAGVGTGSLNLFVALVGPPGAGKDRIVSMTRNAILVGCGDALDPLEPLELSLGSGEGVAEALQPTGEQTVSTPVLFGASELGEVAALMGRQGSTLRGNVLKIYSGNALGFTNRGEKFTVRAHSYTAGLWIGVQPDKAGALLDGQDDGLSHRFVWTELVDPTRPATRQRRDNQPGALLPVSVPREVIDGESVSYHRDIQRETQQMHDVNLRYGVQGHNSGHRHQTRLKLAAGLALLRSSAEVDLEDWKRAGVLMDYSDRVQGSCLAHLQGQRDKEAAERLGERERAEEHLQGQRLDRCRAKALKLLESGDMVTRSQVLQDTNSRQRDVMGAVLDRLELREMITVTDGDRGRQYLQRNPGYTGKWE